MLAAIDALAARVESLWRRTGYAYGEFPRVAREGLRSARFSAEDLIEAIARVPTLPRQLSMESKFGQPPVTIYWGEKFLIDAYFWLEPATQLHNHSFHGAFRVIQGRSLQVRYGFEVHRRFGRNLFSGSLRVRHAEILRTGDVRSIEAGNDFIHRVVHLSHPTVSLVIRTDASAAPILSCLPPGMAATTPQHLTDTGKRKMALIVYLAAAGERRVGSIVRRMTAAADDFHAFWYLFEYFRVTHDLAGARRMARGRAWAAPFEAAIRFHRSRFVKWEDVRDEGERLVAALGMSLEDPALVRRLLTRVAGSRSPGEFVSRAVRGLAEKRAIDLEMNDTAELVLRCVIDGRDPVRALQREYDVSDGGRLARDVRDCRRAFEANPLLKPFLP